MIKMSKKGFTLIELLAVIVILAIIALIATPIVLNIIKDSRESATLRSAENYMDAVNNAIATTNMKEGGTFSPTSCDVNGAGNLVCEGHEEPIVVDVDKEKPVSGNITFNKGKVEEVSLTYSNGKTVVNDEKGNLVYGEKGSVWAYTDENKNGQVDIGDMISIGKEKPQRFHIYENDGTNIKALAEYNLLVGNEVDSEYNVTPLSNPTGLQDPTAKGWNSIDEANGKWYGTTAFSTSSSAYEGSIVEGYVNDYKTELIKLGAKETIQARLITHDELTNENTFNCSEYRTCPDTYSWVYTTSYWSGSPYDGSDVSVWYVISSGYFRSVHYSSGLDVGVRPVIIISLSEI